MQFDPSTAAAVISLVFVILSGATALFSRGYRRYPGARAWVVGNLLMAAGVAIGLGGRADWSGALLVVGNTVSVAGEVLLAVGSARFTGRAWRGLWVFAVVPVTAAFLAYFTAVVPNLTARVAYMSAVGAGLSLVSARQLLGLAVALPQAGRWLSGGAFLGFAAGLVVRLAMFLSRPAPADVFTPSPAQTLLVLLTPVAGVVWTVGFGVMLLDRLAVGLRATAAALERQHEFNRAVLDHLAAGVVVCDPAGMLTFVNPAARDLCEIPGPGPHPWPDESRVFYPGVEMRIPRDDLPPARAARGEQLRDVEIVVRRPDGTSRRLLTSGGPMNGGGLVTLTDVTGLRRAEEVLRRSEEQFRGAFAAAAIGMALVAPDGRFLQVNRSLCDIVGYSEEELLARTFQAITHPDDLDADLGQAHRLWAGEIRSYQMEKRYVHKLGHEIWILLSGSAVRKADGRPLYAVAQIQDITPRKRAEKALRESEALLHSILDNIPAVVFLKDRDGRYLRINRPFAERFGLTPEQVIGKTDLDLFPADVAAEFRANDRAAWEAGQAVEREEVAPYIDGPHTSIVLKVPLRDTGGAIHAICGVATDITERKRAERALRESEARYRRIVETANEGIWTLDAEARTDYVNRRMAEMLGYTPEEMLGRHLFEFMGDEAREEAQRKLDRRGQGVLEQHEFVFRRRDRSELHALLATSPILGEDGTYLGALAMVTDITRRVQAERAAQEAAGRIEQLANNLPGGVVYQDVLPQDGPDRFEWISAGVEQVLGVTPAEVLADPQSLLGRIHPDDVPEFRRRDEESTRSLSPFEMVMRFRGADEDYRWIHVRSMPRRRPEAMTSSSVVVSPGRSAPSPSPGCGGMRRVSVRRPATWTR